MANYMNFFEDAVTDVEETETYDGLGSFSRVNRQSDFDAMFESACDSFRQTWKVDWNDALINSENLKNEAMVASFKGNLLSGLAEDTKRFQAFQEDAARNPEGLDAGSPLGWHDKISKMFDNSVDNLITESASVGQLMPIKLINFPLLVKSNVEMSFKDIVKEEVTSELQVKKRIEKTIAYNKKNPQQTWDVPQCFYDDTFLEMIKAGSGTQLSDKPVDLPIVNKNLVTELTSLPTDTNARLGFGLMIDKVVANDGKETVVTLKNPIKLDLSQNSWIGGKINQTYIDDGGAERTLSDTVTGMIDWITNTTTMSNVNTVKTEPGQEPAGPVGVKAVCFNGKLSNEGNDNTIRTRYVQEERNWFINEKTKVDASYTLEELQEHKAFLNMDLYKKSYNDLVMLLSQMEDSEGYTWLDNEFKKYEGQQFDALGWDPMVIKTEFDCDQTINSLALQSEYIAKELKFKIDRFLIDIADTVKLNNMHFVLWGNPRFVSLLDPYVKWVFRNGDSVGGVKLDYSYGVMTSGDVKVYVVAAKKVNAETHQTLRLLPYVESNETITFKRYKFGTDVVTAKDSGYKDTERMGGSMTYVWATSRYENIDLQAIQAEVAFKNADFVTILNGKTGNYVHVGQ